MRKILFVVVVCVLVVGVDSMRTVTFPKNPFEVKDAGAGSYRIGDRGARWVESKPQGVKNTGYFNNPFMHTWAACSQNPSEGMRPRT